MLFTTRIVPYTEEEQREEDEDLKRIGWNWTTDPDGRTFYYNKETSEKSWTTPIRVQELTEEVEVPGKPDEQRRLSGKQPAPKYYLKAINKDEDDDDEDGESAEVTKTITLQEVYQTLEDWTPGMKAELESQYSKDCLIPISVEDVKNWQNEDKVKVKILPSRLVATKKKKPKAPVKLKARLVACGNKDEDDTSKDTYAGGADVTAVRCALRTAALKDWEVRTKDVSTAFLNAP